MTSVVTEARNATMEDMLAILRAQQAAKFDVVMPAGKLRFTGGQLELSGQESQLTPDGFLEINGLYTPTAVFDGHLADRLDIPARYIRKMREERVDLYDATMNGWLRGRPGKLNPAGRDLLVHAEHGAGDPALGAEHYSRQPIAPDDRNMLVRLFLGGEGGGGIARALLSDRYGTMDNLDGVMAMLAGIRAAGIEGVEFDRCDITDRRVYIRVTAPSIRAMAPELLKGYRNPFASPEIERWRGMARREGMAYSDAEGGEPVVFAGFTFSNSEVGAGRWQLSPQVVVQICKNGLTMTEDVFGKTHLGARLEEGRVQWSAETQALNVQMVTSQTTDVVRQFMTPRWLNEKVEGIERLAGARLAKPAETIEVIGKKLSFSEEAIAGILNHFLIGGQSTAGGVMNAITSYTQTIPDADRAFEMERRALEAGQLAASMRA